MDKQKQLGTSSSDRGDHLGLVRGLQNKNKGKVSQAFKNKANSFGAWVSQSVKCRTLDLGSGHDLTVHEIKPHIRLCWQLGDCLGYSLSPSVPLSLPCSHSLSQTIKHFFKRENKANSQWNHTDSYDLMSEKTQGHTKSRFCFSGNRGDSEEHELHKKALLGELKIRG